MVAESALDFVPENEDMDRAVEGLEEKGGE